MENKKKTEIIGSLTKLTVKEASKVQGGLHKKEKHIKR